MIINYNGEMRNAHILVRAGGRMRIAMEHADDVVELSLVDGIWLSEECVPVSFEFLCATEIPALHPEYTAYSPQAGYLLGRYGVRQLVPPGYFAGSRTEMKSAIRVAAGGSRFDRTAMM